MDLRSSTSVRSRVWRRNDEADEREESTRLDEEPGREGLLKTPERVARSLRFLTKGYREDPEEMLIKAPWEKAGPAEIDLAVPSAPEDENNKNQATLATQDPHGTLWLKT